MRSTLDRYEAKLEHFDIEGTLAFAEHLVTHSSRLWIEAGLEQRQRLQALFFPEGLSFDGEEFRTPGTCQYFTNLEGISPQASEVVDQLTQSSNTPRDSNTLYAWLREVAAMREAA